MMVTMMEKRSRKQHRGREAAREEPTTSVRRNQGSNSSRAHAWLDAKLASEIARSGCVKAKLVGDGMDVAVDA
jgi:hypothetical protein